MTSDESKIHKNLFQIQEQTNCPACGSLLVIKSSHKGPFLGCSAYPTCDYTQSFKAQSETTIIKALPEKSCEICQQSLVLRQGRYGMFISCMDYPTCHYVISTQPLMDTSANAHPVTTKIECPICHKGTLTERQSRFGKRFWGCSTYPTCKGIFNSPPINHTCPVCGSAVLLEKKTAKGIVYQCASKKCDFLSPTLPNIDT